MNIINFAEVDMGGEGMLIHQKWIICRFFYPFLFIFMSQPKSKSCWVLLFSHIVLSFGQYLWGRRGSKLFQKLWGSFEIVFRLF